MDPASGTDDFLDVLVDGERIVSVTPCGKIQRKRKKTQDAETIDAAGLVVAPGFIDLHCHLREPGGESSETIETGTRAARARRLHRGLRHAKHAPD